MHVPLDGRFEYLAEPPGLQGLAQLLAHDGWPWKTAPNHPLSLGFRDTAYWLRIPLQVRPGAAHWLLELGSSTVAGVTFYAVRGRSVLAHQEAGHRLPLGARAMRYEAPVFELPSGDHDPFWVYLRVQSESSLQLPLAAWERSAYGLHVQRWALLQGGFVGALLVMALYNLVLFFGTRDRSYLYYVIFVLLGVLLQAVYRGFDLLLLPLTAVPLRPGQTVPLIFLYITVATLFSRSFLGLDRLHPRLDRLLRWTGYAGLVGGVGALALPYTVTIHSAIALTVGACLFMLASGVAAWLRGSRLARAYTLAWAVFLIGTLLFVFMKLAWLPYSLVTEYAMQVGTFIDVTLLSLALSQRIAMERQARLDAQRLALAEARRARRAQAEALAQEKRAKQRLEIEVARRTHSLRRSLRQLRKANQALRVLSARDELTGVSNRRHLDRRLDAEWRRAQRYGHPLSLVMMDIDLFKRVNDTYGHRAGDHVLQQLAVILRSWATRPSDVVARYGGEEFAVLLPHLGRNEAVRLAERIRRAVEQSHVAWEGHEIRLTASLGVSSMEGDTGILPEALVRAADRAMYAVKRSGRNGVQFLAPEPAAGRAQSV